MRDDCNKYIRQPSFVANNTYSGYFMPPALEFVPDNGLQEVLFLMAVTDEEFNPNVTDISHISYMTIELTDIGNDYKLFRFFAC